MWTGLLAVAATGGALAFAVFGPADRAGAVASVLATLASTAAALTALYLSREALARTERQLELARRATVLSRYPLLVPVHQSIAFPESTGVLAAHPPARERFRLAAPAAGSYAFLEDTTGRFVIPVENTGEGPALQIRGTLWRDDGCVGAVVGPTVLGAGKLMVMTATLSAGAAALPDRFTQALAAVVGPKRDDAAFYYLELAYTDVFANERAAAAVFDSRGSGAWRHVAPPEVERALPAPAEWRQDSTQRGRLRRRGAVAD